jgi:hypothetical protein
VALPPSSLPPSPSPPSSPTPLNDVFPSSPRQSPSPSNDFSSADDSFSDLDPDETFSEDTIRAPKPARVFFPVRETFCDDDNVDRRGDASDKENESGKGGSDGQERMGRDAMSLESSTIRFSAARANMLDLSELSISPSTSQSSTSTAQSSALQSSTLRSSNVQPLTLAPSVRRTSVRPDSSMIRSDADVERQKRWDVSVSGVLQYMTMS